MDLHHLLLAGLPAHSALPPKADASRTLRHFRFVPGTEVATTFMCMYYSHDVSMIGPAASAKNR
jgi:hypothetical protein